MINALTAVTAATAAAAINAQTLRLDGYLHLPNGEHTGARGELRSWDGHRKLGDARVVSTWAAHPHCYVTTRWMQVEVVAPGGAVYTGRSAGNGMLYRGRLTAASRRSLAAAARKVG
jgi:hypothetical protein